MVNRGLECIYCALKDINYMGNYTTLMPREPSLLLQFFIKCEQLLLLPAIILVNSNYNAKF